LVAGVGWKTSDGVSDKPVDVADRLGGHKVRWLTWLVVAGLDGRELLLEEQVNGAVLGWVDLQKLSVSTVCIFGKDKPSIAMLQRTMYFWMAVTTFLNAKQAKGPSCTSTCFLISGAFRVCRKRKSVFKIRKHEIKVPTSAGYSFNCNVFL
jgi:hypothetical protein